MTFYLKVPPVIYHGLEERLDFHNHLRKCSIKSQCLKHVGTNKHVSTEKNFNLISVENVKNSGRVVQISIKLFRNCSYVRYTLKCGLN